MQAWSDHGIGMLRPHGNILRGGLIDLSVGRGVLLDYWDFVQKKYDPNTTHRITLSELQGCAEEQGTTFQPGDVLLIRSGWVDTYNKMDENQRTKLGSVPPNRCTFVGVEQSQEMIDFLHDNYFSAVGGDAPAFEAWPSNQPWYHHEYLLSLWGVPIGEMFDLEKLSVVCKKLGRHTFFFTSSPANVSGNSESPRVAVSIANVHTRRSRKYPQCNGYILKPQQNRQIRTMTLQIYWEQDDSKINAKGLRFIQEVLLYSSTGCCGRQLVE